MAGLADSEINVLLELFELRSREPVRSALLWYEHEYHNSPAEGLDDLKERFGTEGLDHVLDFYRFFELGGVLVKRNAIPADVFFDLFGSPHRMWDTLESVINDIREEWKEPKVAENFEFLANRGRRWDVGMK